VTAYQERLPTKGEEIVAMRAAGVSASARYIGAAHSRGSARRVSLPLACCRSSGAARVDALSHRRCASLSAAGCSHQDVQMQAAR
jgi:hypothetical protein